MKSENCVYMERFSEKQGKNSNKHHPVIDTKITDNGHRGLTVDMWITFSTHVRNIT